MVKGGIDRFLATHALRPCRSPDGVLGFPLVQDQFQPGGADIAAAGKRVQQRAFREAIAVQIGDGQAVRQEPGVEIEPTVALEVGQRPPPFHAAGAY